MITERHSHVIPDPNSNSLKKIYLVQIRLRTDYNAPHFDQTGVQTHDLQIMAAHFMSL